jgi:urea transport system substrate-binding protein
MAASESPVADAALLAVEEINAAGGVLGRRVEAVIADGRSEAPVFAAEAERLLKAEGVAAVFGCWTSACRRTVRPVVERLGGLLFYPVQYEGIEQSPNIVYLGAAPNQQIIPAVKWAFTELGRRFFVAGSDYVFPRTAGAIIGDEVRRLSGEIVGEHYSVLGSADFGGLADRIAAAKPDVILNTINGDSNVAFFRTLRARGIRPDKVPTVSFSVAEPELRSLSARDVAGDYAAWNYFQSLETPENRRFVAAFRARYGPSRVTSDPMEAAYCGVRLWAKAVAAAGTERPDAVREAVGGLTLDAPEGTVRIDPDNRHAWKTVRIGRITPAGDFDVIWGSAKPIPPIPYPPSRSRRDWDAFLEALRKEWGGAWANPGA